jgi:hypothetical protein
MFILAIAESGQLTKEKVWIEILPTFSIYPTTDKLSTITEGV